MRIEARRLPDRDQEVPRRPLLVSLGWGDELLAVVVYKKVAAAIKVALLKTSKRPMSSPPIWIW